MKAAEGELTSLGIMQPYIHGEVCSPDWPYCLQDAAEQTMQSCLTGVVVGVPFRHHGSISTHETGTR